MNHAPSSLARPSSLLLTLRTSGGCEYEWGPFRRLFPPGVLSEKEGEGELGGRVMELMRLGPLSILRGAGKQQQGTTINTHT